MTRINTFFFLTFFHHVKSKTVNFNMPEIDEKDFNSTSHLKFETVWEYCANRDEACKSNNTNICAVKVVNNKKYYKDYKNGCYLFLSNMCDNPSEEYFIMTTGSCLEYFATRRSGSSDASAEDEIDNNSNETKEKDGSQENKTVTKAALRQAKTTMTTLYEIDTSFDYHLCPHSCPNSYSPVCVNVNRGFGKYFKLLTFVNHCSADVYYCKNWREFEPPPNEDESVRASPLAWSFCGASRYLQFARFAEATSSMGYYGWLAGDYKYSHIMEPHQRRPGYG